MCVCVCARACVCIGLLVDVCIWPYVYVHTRMYVCARTYMHASCVHMYTCRVKYGMRTILECTMVVHVATVYINYIL